METNALGILGTGLMAAVTFPLALGIARLCLKGLLRFISPGPGR